MTTQTKIFLALVLLVIGGGLAYWKWQEAQEPIIDVKELKKTGENSMDITFRMAYKGISYTETIQFGSVWVKHKKGYTFAVTFDHGKILFFIKGLNDTVITYKEVSTDHY